MTRPGTKKSSDGLAMIMVLVMIVIFASLILAVVISSTTAIRRAHYYKDKSTALQIAEAGLQEILFKMNYENYDSGGVYPFEYGTIPETQIDFLGPDAKDFATVKIDQTQGDTQLVSTGIYRGRSAQVKVKLRGHAKLGDALNSDSHGIPDAFVKKTIYAIKTEFLPTALPEGRIIKGNVTTSSDKPSPFPWSEATWTETDISISDIVHFDTKNCVVHEESKPGHYSFIPHRQFKDDDGLTPYIGFTGYEAALLPSHGIAYTGDGATDAYTLSSCDPGYSSEHWQFERAATNEVTVTIGNGRLLNSNFVIQSGAGGEQGDINVNFSGTAPDIQGMLIATRNINIGTGSSTIGTGTAGTLKTLWAGGTITINGSHTINGDIVGNEIIFASGSNPTINGNLYSMTDIVFQGATVEITGDIYAGGGINFSGATVEITGDVISIGSATFNASSNCTINGSLLTKNSTTNLLGTIAIDASGSEYGAAVIVYPGGDGTLDISTPLAITLGEKQKAGILVCAENGTINVNNTLAITYANEPPDQFAIVNYSGAYANNATVNILANLILRGSIYSYKNITLNDNTQITGILIAGDTLKIGSNSRIAYNPDTYSNPTVYKGFTGGRRRYVPVPGSWEVVW